MITAQIELLSDEDREIELRAQQYAGRDFRELRRVEYTLWDIFNDSIPLEEFVKQITEVVKRCAELKAVDAQFVSEYEGVPKIICNAFEDEKTRDNRISNALAYAKSALLAERRKEAAEYARLKAKFEA